MAQPITIKFQISRFKPALGRAMEGYNRERLVKDLTAGLIVGVVAIPLAVAFAIASGVLPEQGLVTAIVAGFLVSLLGGSRVQIGGPTGAFVVIVFGIVERYGIEGLILSTFMAGIILVLFGLFRLGQIIKFIPFPVITGFTAGIGTIIFLGQLKEILGLDVAMPSETLPRLSTIAGHIGETNPWALGIAGGTVATIVLIKRFLPRLPGPVVALALFTAATALFHLPVDTVSDRFGELPRGLPAPHIPDVSLDLVRTLLPPALTIALLGAIESLLSAVVADGMIEDKHDSDQELMAQGVANLASPLFGGIPATGAIARTATNVQNGATSPIAGITHAGLLFVFITFLAGTVEIIPLAVLGGILAVVSYNMSDVERFRRVSKMPRSDSVVLLATYAITVLVDLVVAVEVGMVLAAFLFMARMGQVARFEVIHPEEDDRYRRQQSIEGKDVPQGVAVYSVDGPFFFGAAEQFQKVIEGVAEKPKVMILRMRHVPYMDATGVTTLESIVKNFRKHGTTVILSAVQIQPMEMLMRGGIMPVLGDANVRPNIDAAIERAREIVEGPKPPAPPPQPPADADAGPVSARDAR